MKKNRRFVVSEFVKTCDELATYETNFVILNGHGQQVVGLQSQTFYTFRFFLQKLPCNQQKNAPKSMNR